MTSSTLEELYKFYLDSVVKEDINHKNENIDYALWLLKYKKVLDFYKAFLLSKEYKLDESIIELNKGVSDSLGEKVINVSDFIDPMGKVSIKDGLLILFAQGVFKTFPINAGLYKTVIVHNPYKIIKRHDEEKIIDFGRQGIQVAYSTYGYDDDMDRDAKIKKTKMMAYRLNNDRRIEFEKKDGMYIAHTQNF